jgi:hypothetical protein
MNHKLAAFTGMIKKHILKGAEEALERISEKVSYV